jgi:hypothetical protein
LLIQFRNPLPNYLITVFLKTGVRWHPSYDADHVKALVAGKVRKTLGTAAVKWVDLEIVARTTGDRMDTKNLTP